VELLFVNRKQEYRVMIRFAKGGMREGLACLLVGCVTLV
jgi:hypothetical protein